MPGDHGFRIQILGHAVRYTPGQVYTGYMSYVNLLSHGYISLFSLGAWFRPQVNGRNAFQYGRTYGKAVRQALQWRLLSVGRALRLVHTRPGL